MHSHIEYIILQVMQIYLLCPGASVSVFITARFHLDTNF